MVCNHAVVTQRCLAAAKGALCADGVVEGASRRPQAAVFAEALRLRAVVCRPSKDPIADLRKRASLLRTDSIHGAFNATIEVDEENLEDSLLSLFRIEGTPTLNRSYKPLVLLFDEYYTDLYRMSEAERRAAGRPWAGARTSRCPPSCTRPSPSRCWW